MNIIGKEIFNCQIFRYIEAKPVLTHRQDSTDQTLIESFAPVTIALEHKY